MQVKDPAPSNQTIPPNPIPKVSPMAALVFMFLLIWDELHSVFSFIHVSNNNLVVGQEDIILLNLHTRFGLKQVQIIDA